MDTPKTLPATPEEILKPPYEQVLIREPEGGFLLILQNWKDVLLR